VLIRYVGPCSQPARISQNCGFVCKLTSLMLRFGIGHAPHI
jgi:hypothetical protein